MAQFIDLEKKKNIFSCWYLCKDSAYVLIKKKKKSYLAYGFLYPGSEN